MFLSISSLDFHQKRTERLRFAWRQSLVRHINININRTQKFMCENMHSVCTLQSTQTQARISSHSMRKVVVFDGIYGDWIWTNERKRERVCTIRMKTEPFLNITHTRTLTRRDWKRNKKAAWEKNAIQKPMLFANMSHHSKLQFRLFTFIWKFVDLWVWNCTQVVNCFTRPATDCWLRCRRKKP